MNDNPEVRKTTHSDSQSDTKAEPVKPYRDKELWRRALFMVLFVVAFNVVELLIGIVTVFQFISKLVSGKTNQQLSSLARALGEYLKEVVAFLTFTSEHMPYPFSPWKDVKDVPPSGGEAKKTTAKKASAKKTSAKKTAAKKTSAKKSAAKKSVTKKAAATKPTENRTENRTENHKDES